MIINEADGDRDGLIDYTEFYKMMHPWTGSYMEFEIKVLNKTCQFNEWMEPISTINVDLSDCK